jgi:hypothetical protein
MGIEEKCFQVLVGKSKASDSWGELDLDGMAVLEWMLERQV